MPKQFDEQVRALQLGTKIRELRTQKHMTLQDVSDLTGLSKPLLSQIENCINTPTIPTLLKIATALGVEVGYFFGEPPPDSRMVVLRHHEREEAMRRLSGKTAPENHPPDSLGYPRSAEEMEPFVIQIEPCSLEDMRFYTHQGEEFLFVLEGSVEFRNAHTVTSLGPGDSIYFDAELPHAIRGLEDRSSRAVMVVYSAASPGMNKSIRALIRSLLPVSKGTIGVFAVGGKLMVPDSGD